MPRIYLEELTENLAAESLPANWTTFDLASFSNGKQLWSYQQTALSNALAALWKYYHGSDAGLEDTAAQKEAFLQWYLDFGLEQNLDIPLDRSSRARRQVSSLLEDYFETDETGKNLPYVQFINRMSFWMATGSGKTLVIVKLIELLQELIKRGEIPANDILVLAHRDDLLTQLQKHVDDFNNQGSFYIHLRELREYAEVKHAQPTLLDGQELTVFYYRSDNLSDEQKEKIIDFRSYDNDGGWYILLDEAHKGDREDSKRQHIYSILSRNGFLFNFSATFTDDRDIISTVSNYNLSEFIRKGHGKHITILQQEARAFRRNEDYSDDEKQKIILKGLIMLAYTRQFEQRVRQVRPDLYHRPLLMALVNSVNTEDADLKLFFRELVRIGKGEIEQQIWEQAKNELLQELRDQPEYLFESRTPVQIHQDVLYSIDQASLLKAVFNANGPGEIEVLVRPSNRKEVAFKLKTSDDPFALVRIGDISDWLKDELTGYEINRQVTDEGYFTRLNQPDSDINILLGSRSFYEGWDSNRPNVIMYVNIGTSTDARKFILQSVGRGVRIEPLRNQRKRLRELHTSGELQDPDLFNAIKDAIQPLESVFIFGTNREALEVVISELDQESKKTATHEISLALNEEAINGKLLLVPVYQSSDVPLYRKRNLSKFSLTEQNLALLQRYLEYVDDDRVFLALHDNCQPAQVKALRESMQDTQSTFRTDGPPFKNLDVLTRQALGFFSIHGKEFDQFKELEDEINHFQHIKVSLEQLGDLERRIQKVLDSGAMIKEAQAKFEARQMSIDEYTQTILDIPDHDSFHADGATLKIRRLEKHYYIPVLLTETERVSFIRSIIHVPSEVRFLHQLEDYLKQKNNKFKEFDWWLFSRIDEQQDRVNIPYYNPIKNRISHFNPDFIFWLKKGEDYHIVFVDPKGTGRTEYEHKVDGYRNLFEENGEPKVFHYQNLNVRVHVFLFTADSQYLAEGYRRYWFDNIDQMLENL
ncbi:MAG: DEAD/DEAH box helicase family protein [Anaerolineaceae bacterium]|nr:DEAD/DEAH box helicase family protein [Anaerolineaceae bacterium]